jgi:ABC-type antimicrobial peptide transport system permease subunit
MRTFLTILGVGVGIGTVLFLVSLGYGLERVISSKIGSNDALLSLDVSPGSSVIMLNKQSVESISKIQNVAEVSPLINYSAQISAGELTGDGMVYAAEPSFFRLGDINADSGRLFTDQNAKEVVISSAMSKLFNFQNSDALGKDISLTLFTGKTGQENSGEGIAVKRNDKYKIVGIIKDDTTSFAFAPVETLRDMGTENFSQLKIKVASKASLDQVRLNIIDQGFLVSSLSDTLEQADKIFRVIQIVLALFGLVALVVSAIGMFNTMTIALLERINEVGIMRSIGASSSDIMILFLIESLLMGFLGGVGGIMIGYFGGAMANFGLNLLAKNFGGESLSIFYSPMWFIAFIMIFSSVIGLLTGFFPARKASRLNTLVALRYK